MATIREINEGMRVVSASGDDVGKVDDLKMGDPTAASAEGQDKGDHASMWSAVVENIAGSEPQVPAEQQERMKRLGYIRVNATGLFSGHFYVAADGIQRVEADTVHLTFTPQR